MRRMSVFYVCIQNFWKLFSDFWCVVQADGIFYIISIQCSFMHILNEVWYEKKKRKTTLITKVNE